MSPSLCLCMICTPTQSPSLPHLTTLHMAQIELWPQHGSLILILASKIGLLSRFPEATQQEWEGTDSAAHSLSSRSTEVGCKSLGGQRSSVFIMCAPFILRVIISRIMLLLWQEVAGMEVRKWRDAAPQWLVAPQLWFETFRPKRPRTSQPMSTQWVCSVENCKGSSCVSSSKPP